MFQAAYLEHDDPTQAHLSRDAQILQKSGQEIHCGMGFAPESLPDGIVVSYAAGGLSVTSRELAD
jgi:hypothetical protein